MAYRQTVAIRARIADTRERILKAARDLVAEGGWRHAKIARIAGRADVATGSIYRHFPSKAVLYAEVLARVSKREADIVAGIASGEGTFEERLRLAVRTFAMRAFDGRRLAYALLAEPCDPEIDAARLVWRRRLSEEFLKLIAAGQKAGAFRAGAPEIAAAAVVGACIEPLIGPLAPDNVKEGGGVALLIDGIVENCVAMVRREA